LQAGQIGFPVKIIAGEPCEILEIQLRQKRADPFFPTELRQVGRAHYRRVGQGNLQDDQERHQEQGQKPDIRDRDE